MKINLTTFALAGMFALGCSPGIAQNGKFSANHPYHEGHERCGIIEHEQYLMSKNPNRQAEREQFEQTVNNWINSQKQNPQPQGMVIIPVVVHVVYNTTAENISTNQVNSQITVLNQDFTRTNPDAANTPTAFQSLAANTNISFCLAQRDPSGNPTTGIVRRQTTVTQFSTNDAVKFTNQGGSDAWPVTQYLNIWVCDLGSSLLGYGEFPTGSPSNTFGLVCNYTAFGTMGTAQAPFNLGRTSTHEIGHCFNLRHIWGDEPNCAQDDLVSDTPMQKSMNYGCPTYPQTTQSGGRCNTSDPSSMFMNYMDYVNDNCMNMFSNGQSTRMNAVINVAPYNALTTSNGCQPVNLQNNDAGILSITTPNGTVCSGTFTPVVVLKNYGSNALTSCVINYYIDANPPSTFNWTGNLASNATTNVTLGSMTTTGGAHTFTASTSSPNNQSDPQTSNDQTTSNFTVTATGTPLPYSYGFEPVTFPPTGWTLSNPDAGITWARTTQAAKTGVASMWFNSNNYTCNGCVDITTLQALNLSSVTNPQITFQVAYQLLSDPNQNPNWSDTLIVEISTDCGVSWTEIYRKYAVALTTVVPTFSTTPFVPTNSQWRQETVSLNPYASSSNAFIRFKAVSDYENNLYVDDININGLTGTGSIDLNGSVSVFPNPSNGYVYVNFGLADANDISVRIVDVMGQVVEQREQTARGTIMFNMSDRANGVYFVEIIANGQSITRKLVLNK